MKHLRVFLTTNTQEITLTISWLRTYSYCHIFSKMVAYPIIRYFVNTYLLVGAPRWYSWVGGQPEHQPSMLLAAFHI